MVYLIDDKKSRQETLGWNNIQFRGYKNIITALYTYTEIEQNKLSENIFGPNNFILFHESFFDNVANKMKETAIREKLDLYAKEKNITLVKFGGAISTRTLNGYQLTMPVDLMYRNLKTFLDSVEAKDDRDTSLRKLMFGLNYKIEEVLILKKEIWETKFKMSPLLNTKLRKLNEVAHKQIDLNVDYEPRILKALINE